MQKSQPETIEEFLKQITEFMQISCELTVATQESGAVHASLQAAEDGRLLIGKNGQNLNALEHVVRMMWMRSHPEQRAVVVDVNNYRADQTSKLVESVHAMAQRVQQTRRSEALDPMSSYQRRIVHTELAVYSDLATESVGQDPHRRVVIKPL